MTQWWILGEVQLLKQIEPAISLEIDKVLKLNMEDEAIDFEWSNKITQKRRISWPYRGRLENQLKLANEIARVGKKFLKWSRNIWKSTWISQWGRSRGG